jgi:hypothetical protein
LSATAFPAGAAPKAPGQLAKLLNKEAGDGWQLRTITAADVKGRVGPGGVDGLLVTFERPVG